MSKCLSYFSAFNKNLINKFFCLIVGAFSLSYLLKNTHTHTSTVCLTDEKKLIKIYFISCIFLLCYNFVIWLCNDKKKVDNENTIKKRTTQQDIKEIFFSECFDPKK
jgi:hypothetical protein